MNRTYSALALILLLSACAKPQESTQSPAQVASVNQCSKDTDCKGDRICDKGACAFPSSTQVQSPPVQVKSSWPPAFSDYASGDNYVGKFSMPALSSAPELFEQEFAQLHRKQINFASEYIVISVPTCADWCFSALAFNVKTGKFIRLPDANGVGSDQVYLTRHNSRLLTINGTLDEDSESVEGQHYFELQGDQLTPISQPSSGI